MNTKRKWGGGKTDRKRNREEGATLLLGREGSEGNEEVLRNPDSGDRSPGVADQEVLDPVSAEEVGVDIVDTREVFAPDSEVVEH